MISGATREIGKAIAEAFLLLGDNVSACSRHEPIPIKEASTNSLQCRCDASVPKQVAHFIETAVDHFGPIDVLVNNAGINQGKSSPLMSSESWDEVIRTNLYGTFHLCRAATSGLIKNQAGVILNVSSVAGVTGNRGQANYSAAKGGISALTLTLAKELGPFGIRVNAVAPGFIETDMTSDLPPKAKQLVRRSVPLRRFGSVSDVASLVTFLCSPQASYITGQIIRIDGELVL
ncbi:SDR family oxidoreductase [Arachnia propionica]|jgi:3-oxoacyl-(acyl carrier protein) reductase|uniref:SDR family oxidoreductase n=1 Tax=Arachnia propionica TaxID=1750 RepID=UPI001BA6DB75|nr:SDR family NAD(P)-dependent oxidoreductase [Arachnia propionica]QUC14630.1 SDR family oxidoreductase [Arachnia propionica]